MKGLEIIYKSLDDIVPYENNPRDNELAIEKVKKSIEEFGFNVPILLDKNDTIVAGHTRYKASLELELEEVPCIYMEHLTPVQVRAFRLADNKVSEFADWNIELLTVELEEILAEGEKFTGFSDNEIASLIGDFGVDKYFEETQAMDDKEPKTIKCPHCGEEIEI